MKTKTLTGFVVDFHGAPIAKAKIYRNDKIVASTNKNGMFAVSGEKLGKRAAFTISANGYMDNTVIVNSKTVSISPVILAKLPKSSEFESGKGAKLKFGQSKLEIPPDAFVDLSGKQVKGKIRFDFNLLDTSDPLQLEAAMGDFSGIMSDGREVKLRSFGIMELKAYDSSGRKLQLAPDRGIKASIKIPKNLVKFAPGKTGLFRFETKDGIWVQTGWVELNPATLTYNGTIKDMNGVNIDDPNVLTCITIQLTGSAGMPWSGIKVTAYGNGYISQATVDASGRTCLLVGVNDIVSIKVFGQNPSSSYYMNPFNEHIQTPSSTATSNDCNDPTKCPEHVVLVGIVVGEFKVAHLKGNITRSNG